MRIDGRWLKCDDGVTRPILHGAVLIGDGSWWLTEFLMDSGADLTVLSAATLSRLSGASSSTPVALGGLGGLADAVSIETRIRLLTESGAEAIFRGPFHAAVHLEALDINVLGRDITDHFATIFDRSGDVACLICQRHRYRIEIV